MAKAPTDQTGNFEFRVGVGDFAYAGMMQDPDPGAIPPNRVRFIRNGRFQGGAIVSRPPYEPVIPVEKFVRENYVEDVLTPSYGYWDLHYFTEHHPAFPVRVWYGGKGRNQSGSEAGGFVGFIDLEADPMLQPVGNYAQVTNRTPSIAKFDGEIYVGEYGFLHKVYQIKTPPGVTPIQYGSLPADDIIWNFGYNFVDVLYSHLGKLYMLVVDPTGAANGKIWSYDGQTVSLEYSLSIPGNTGGCATSWRDELIFGINGLGSILIRAADGTWSTKTCADFEVSPSKSGMAAIASGVWIVDGVNKLYQYDGSSLSLQATVSWPWERVRCCTTMGPYVYFGASAIVGTGPFYRHRLCRMDSYDNALVYFTPDTEGGQVDAICAHGGRLFVSYGGEYIKTHPTPYVPCSGPFDLSEEANGWFSPASYSSVGGAQYTYTAVEYMMST